MADLTEYDFYNQDPNAARALARQQQAQTNQGRLLARAMQLSGDPVLGGVGQTMSNEAALADQALQQAAHGAIGHEVQRETLENALRHQSVMENIDTSRLAQTNDLRSRALDIAQQRVDLQKGKTAAGGSARALAASEKFGKPGNIPGLIAQLYPVAAMGRDDIVKGKLAGFIGTGEDASQTWDMYTSALVQEMGNISHGSASETAVNEFKHSRPGALASPALKMQWLRQVSQWGYHQSELVNGIAQNAGFQQGIVPEEVMTGWQAVHGQLFGQPLAGGLGQPGPSQAPPLRGPPVVAPPPPGGPRPIARPPAPSPAPPPPGGAPPAGPPQPAGGPPPGPPGPAGPPQLPPPAAPPAAPPPQPSSLASMLKPGEVIATAPGGKPHAVPAQLVPHLLQSIKGVQIADPQGVLKGAPGLPPPPPAAPGG